jgi:hypothetical protein
VTGRKYWAKRRNQISGPHPTQEAALAAFRAAYPAPPTRKNEICTGYGSDGPWFDIRWSPAE